MHTHEESNGQIDAHELDTLKRELAFYKSVAEQARSWEMWLDPAGETVFCTPACERLTGYPVAKFQEDPQFLRRLLHPDDIEHWDRLFDPECAVGCGVGERNCTVRLVRMDGRERWIMVHAEPAALPIEIQGNEAGDSVLRLCLRDVTSNKLMESQLQHQATHDPLTGLPNRTLCLDYVEKALERSKRRSNYHYAVVYLGLDRFKNINDSFGHGEGDELLRLASERITEAVRSLDTVARLGGDEFCLLLEEITSPRAAMAIVRRVREQLGQPVEIQGHTIYPTASLGVVFSPAHYNKPEDLLRNAGIAMQKAKELGRDRVKVFDAKMLDRAVQLMSLEIDLRRALEREEFFLEYQPILSLTGKTLIGFEALVRWNHPDQGVIPPLQFINVAEDTGLIIPLGEWVLRRACQDMALWQREHPEWCGLSVCVNMSAKQVVQPDIVERVSRILRREGLAPQCLKLEITESVVMEKPELARLVLERLKGLGVRLSIDDFGTGYSSLSYLQRFPLDTLKVDKSFVGRMGQDPENREIVKAVIALAHSLGLDVVAEGVEEPHQYSMLESMDCEHIQGYLFSRPVASDKARDMLRNGFAKSISETVAGFGPACAERSAD